MTKLAVLVNANRGCLGKKAFEPSDNSSVAKTTGCGTNNLILDCWHTVVVYVVESTRWVFQEDSLNNTRLLSFRRHSLLLICAGFFYFQYHALPENDALCWSLLNLTSLPTPCTSQCCVSWWLGGRKKLHSKERNAHTPILYEIRTLLSF